MSRVTVEPTPQDHSDPAEDLARARLRLYDAASSLKPIDGPGDLAERVREVARELRDIQESLLLYVHCQQLEAGDFNDRLDAITVRLAEGWVPEGSPVDDVVERLRASTSASA